MKKVRFGAGKYNGMGGGVEEGETPAEAAVREAKEEVGVDVRPEDALPRGAIRFSFEGKLDWDRFVSVFVSERWEGKPAESEEMAPEWFALDKIPYEKMWVDDTFWLPQVLAGKTINAAFHFSNDGSEILSQHIDIIT